MEGSTPVPLRRKDAMAVHSLHRFVFSVPDLARPRPFYGAFGLDVRESEGRVDLHTVGHPHRWASIYQRPGPKQLEYVSFGAYADDFDAVAKRLAQGGRPDDTPHPLADEQGVWIARSRWHRRSRSSSRPRCPRRQGARPSAPPVAPGRGAAPVALGRGRRAPAAPVAHPALQRRRAALGSLLHGGARPAPVRPFGRHHRVPSWRACQRPPHARVREIRWSGPPSFELGRRDASTMSASACSRWPTAVMRTAGAWAGM